MKVKTTKIQYGNDWFKDYIVYTEYINDNNEVIECTIKDQDDNDITDENLLDSVFEHMLHTALPK